MDTIEEIYRLYFKDVYLYIMIMAKDCYVAEEITQETFFKAMKSIKKFRGECDIRVWLCQIAKNTYFSWCKKNKVDMREELNDDIPDTTYSIETKYEDKETIENVVGILKNMDEPYREVFYLRIHHEKSFKEIGKAFMKTENWARVTFYRAKQKLLQEMENTYE